MLKPNKTYRAFMERLKLASPWELETISRAGQAGIDAPKTMYAHWSTKVVPNLIKLENVTLVMIDPSSDGGDYVVNLVDVDGASASLWCHGHATSKPIPARQVTDY
jgi:hypothetical protein